MTYQHKPTLRQVARIVKDKRLGNSHATRIMIEAAFAGAN